MQSGCLVALDFTARHADTIMEGFWTKGRNAVRAGAVEKPHAWIIPLEQSDLFAAKRLLTVLKTHGIEIHQLTADLKIEETIYKQGSLVVRMDQPYRNFAKTLLEVQEWPEDSETRPYDSTAWTLGLMLGVETIKVDDKKIFDASMNSVSENPFKGIVDGASGGPLLAPPQGNAMIAALLSLKDIAIRVVDEEFSVDGRVFPPGTWVLAEESAKVAEVCRDIGLMLYSSAGAKLPPTRPLKLPRMAMYCGWFSTQSAGWARWTLDEIGIPWTWITRDRVRAGNLADDFDVIIIPDHDPRTEGLDFLRGVDERHGSLAFDKTEEFQYLGSPIGAAKTTGGLGFEGLAAIEKFLQEGGTLITLGSGSTVVTDFGLLSGVERETSDKLVCPGTIVSSWVRQQQNPIVYGYEEHPGFYRNSLPLFTVSRHMRKHVVAQFGTKLPKDVENELSDEEKEAYEKRKEVELLQSGLLKNGEALDGTAAIIDAPAGEGRIVMFAFNPFYRWMSHSAFPLVYNAIMHWNAPAEIREEKGTASNQ
jgi:hypothetical protein